jgi:hypothetical protein
LPAPQGVAPVPASCQAHVTLQVPGCTSSNETVLGELSQALGITSELDRDRALIRLEACPAFAPGLIRALRVELAPSLCADALVDAYFERSANDVRPLRADLKDLQFGLGIAARLDRVELEPPVDATATQNKEKFQEFFKSKLAPWIVQQAKAIHELLEQAAKLQGYGRGVAAISAGIADLRFVELTRGLPLPADMQNDAALRDAYYGMLDQVLEPRKQRGRDAALVGLKELAQVGVLHGERLEQARRLLSSQYAGRRVDLLDGLLLPPLGTLKAEEPTVALLINLPSYYVVDVVANLDVSHAVVLRALLEQGVPRRYGTQLHSAALTSEAREQYARLLFELGRKYWRASDFKEAAAIAGFQAPGAAPSDAQRLLQALALALQDGPESTAEMMLKGPFLGGSPKVEALDRLSQEKSAVAGLAAYDAALLVSLNPPTEGAQQFWSQLEKRYRSAAKLLKDPAEKKEAQLRADAAAQTAKAAR